MQTATNQQNFKRVLIVDDHPIVRQGLSAIISAQRDLQVVCEAENADDARRLVATQALDLVIVDVSLEHSSGIELIKQLRAMKPDLKMLVLSMHDERLYAERALRAGAQGYIMKLRAADSIVSAIRQVLQGRIYLSHEMTERMLRQATGSQLPSPKDEPPVARLSDRELEVFTLIGRGMGTREIAEHLHLSIKTIETYRANIKSKLALDNAAQLVQRAVQWHQTQ